MKHAAYFRDTYTTFHSLNLSRLRCLRNFSARSALELQKKSLSFSANSPQILITGAKRRYKTRTYTRGSSSSGYTSVFAFSFRNSYRGRALSFLSPRRVF